MAMKPGCKEVFWMAVGAAVLLVLMLVVWHVQRGQSPAEQVAFKARRVDLVERMRLALASASEAEKSAVLAVTDEDSQKFADQARAATAEVEQGGKELAELVQASGTSNEKDLLAQFSKAFVEFQRIDRDEQLRWFHIERLLRVLGLPPDCDRWKQIRALWSTVGDRNKPPPPPRPEKPV